MITKKFTYALTAALLTAGVAFGQNDATVEQNNDFNEATVEQIGSNTAEVNQISKASGPSEKNDASVMQDGQGNFLDYDVEGHTNTLDADQEGPGNQAVIDQKSLHDGDFNYGNDVKVEQISYGMEGDMGATEAHGGNHAYLKLKGDENDIDAKQEGTANYIGGSMEGGGELTAESHHFFRYEGDASTIDLDQKGTANYLNGEVHNSFGIVDTDQSGTLNSALLSVGAESGLLFNNEITVQQEGTFNGTYISQESNANAASVHQNGMGNWSSVRQQ